MPVTEIPLDSSTREEHVTLLHGKNLLLKLIENEHTKQTLSDADIQQFLSTQDLCHRNFREVIDKMIQVERDLERSLQMESMIASERMEYLTYVRRTKTSPRAQKAAFSNLLPRLKKSMNAVTRRLLSDNKQLLALEDRIKKFNPGLEALTPTVLLRCPKCGVPFFKAPPDSHRRRHEMVFSPGSLDLVIGELKGSVECRVCHTVFDRDNALRTNLHVLKRPLRELWESNLWLEDYTSKILRSMNWQTWPHVSVLGSSGVRHEIDVLGVKGSYVLVCECKTGRVTRQDVFNFWAKVYDIKSHVSMLSLIGELPEPETREFVTKNPSVFLLEKMGEKGRKQIVEEAQKGILGRI